MQRYSFRICIRILEDLPAKLHISSDQLTYPHRVAQGLCQRLRILESTFLEDSKKNQSRSGAYSQVGYSKLGKASHQVVGRK